jgi:hypothetical protein
MSREEENTFRLLKNEPLVETRPIRCLLGFHKWTKYGQPKGSSSSIYIRQGRFCVACNHYQERKFHE